MDATAVQLTSPCPGAIAVILLTGTDASQVLHAATRPGCAARWHRARLPRVEIISAAGATIDDALLVCLAPKRYELHVHGGTAVVDAVLQRLTEAGCGAAAGAGRGRSGAGIDGEVLLCCPRPRRPRHCDCFSTSPPPVPGPISGSTGSPNQAALRLSGNFMPPHSGV